MHDPPPDNNDPKANANEELKFALTQLAHPDWLSTFRLFGRPSNGHVQLVAQAALARIRELESQVPQ